jgi:type IV secretion system protein VirD4
MLPKTDPLRPRFFTQQRTVGSLTMLVSLAALGIYYLFIQTPASRYLELMSASNWKRYIGEERNIAFIVKCVPKKVCRDELAIFFHNDLYAITSLSAACFVFFFALGLIMALPKRTPLYGARFAKLRDVLALVVKPNAEYVFLYIKLGGKFLGTQFNKALRKMLEHCVVISPSGGGKSVHAKAVLGTFSGSMIVIDIKGELYDDTATYRQDMTDMYRINLDGRSAKYNPFADIGDSELELKAAAQILMMDPSDRDPIFAQRAMSAVRAALHGAVLLKQPVLPYLLELTNLGPMRFIETLTTLGDDEVNRNLTTFLGKPPEEFLVDGAQIFDEGKGFLPSAWGTLITRLEPFTTKNVLSILSGNDFRARELIQSETTVYLTFSEKFLESSSRVIALLLEGLFTGMAEYADAQGGSGDVPCLVMMDEAAWYPFPSLPKYISTLRGRGIALLIYLQSEAQLRTGYKEAAETILDNCKVKMYWSPSVTTAKSLSEIFGDREVKQTKKGKNGQLSEDIYTKRPLMTADEIMRVEPTEAFLLVRGYHPVRGKRLMWYAERFIKRRLT